MSGLDLFLIVFPFSLFHLLFLRNSCNKQLSLYLIKKHSDFLSGNQAEQQLSLVARSAVQPGVLRAPTGGVDARARAAKRHHQLVLVLPTPDPRTPQSLLTHVRRGHREQSPHADATVGTGSQQLLVMKGIEMHARDPTRDPSPSLLSLIHN